MGLPQQLSDKETTCRAGDSGDAGSIPRLGRSPGDGNGNPLQYSCLKKSQEQRSLVGYSPKGLRVRQDRANEHTVDIYGFLGGSAVKN